MGKIFRSVRFPLIGLCLIALLVALLFVLNLILQFESSQFSYEVAFRLPHVLIGFAAVAMIWFSAKARWVGWAAVILYAVSLIGNNLDYVKVGLLVDLGAFALGGGIAVLSDLVVRKVQASKGKD